MDTRRVLEVLTWNGLRITELSWSGYNILRVSFFGNVDSPFFPSSLRPAGDVHRVAEQAVAGHALSNDAGHHFARMYPDGHFLKLGTYSF